MDKPSGRGQNAVSNYCCSQAAHIAYRVIEGELIGTSEKQSLEQRPLGCRVQTLKILDKKKYSRFNWPLA